MWLFQFVLPEAFFLIKSQQYAWRVYFWYKLKSACGFRILFHNLLLTMIFFAQYAQELIESRLKFYYQS